MNKRYFAGKMMPRLLEEFNEYESKLNGEKASDLFRFRKNAITEFGNSGFPSRKHEEWKYASLDFINKIDFKLAGSTVAAELTYDDIEPFLFKDADLDLIVVVDGVFSQSLSKISEISAGVTVGGISNLEDLPEKHKDLFGKLANDYSRNPFDALNSAFFKDMVYIHIPEGFHLTRNLHILNIIDARKADVQAFPRQFIVADNASGASIIETFSKVGDFKALCNSVTEIYLDRCANIEYNKFQNTPAGSYYIGETSVSQEAESEFTANTLSFSGDFVRNNNNNLLAGERSVANLNGFYYVNENNLIDNSTLVDHSVANCQSNELYKGILDDKGIGNFNGKILVRPDAQQTNAYQTNRNMLLSDDATINTKPQLEIYADDVKCSHGATSGSFDEEALFYLRARGIGEKKARALLLNAFAEEVAGRIRNKKLSEIISARIGECLNI